MSTGLQGGQGGGQRTHGLQLGQGARVRGTEPRGRTAIPDGRQLAQNVVSTMHSLLSYRIKSRSQLYLGVAVLLSAVTSQVGLQPTARL